MSIWKLESLASGTNQSCGTFRRAKVLHHSAQKVASGVEELLEKGEEACKLTNADELE